MKVACSPLNEQKSSGKTERKPKPHFRRWPPGDAGKPSQQSHKKGHRRHQQSRQARRDVLLGECQPAVAAKEQTSAHNERCSPIRQRRPRGTPPARHDKQDCARHQKARAAHQKRRDRLNREADAEIGRTPNDVNHGKGPDNLSARRQMHGFNFQRAARRRENSSRLVAARLRTRRRDWRW